MRRPGTGHGCELKQEAGQKSELLLKPLQKARVCLGRKNLPDEAHLAGWEHLV